jgi:hypothetical protein
MSTKKDYRQEFTKYVNDISQEKCLALVDQLNVEMKGAAPGMSLLCALAMTECLASSILKVLKKNHSEESSFCAELLAAIKKLDDNEDYISFLSSHYLHFRNKKEGEK